MREKEKEREAVDNKLHLIEFSDITMSLLATKFYTKTLLHGTANQ